MAHEFHGCGHVPGLNLAADIGAGDPDVVHSLLRHHGKGQTALLTEGAQLFCIALAPVAEVKIITADETGGIFLHQFFQKFLPGLTHGFRGHGQNPDFLHAIAAQQKLPVGDGADEDSGGIGKQGFGMAVEGDGGREAAMVPGQGAAGFQKLLMPQMNAVKKSKSVDVFVHNITVLIMQNAK